MSTSLSRSPKELIQIYWDEVWNNRNSEMIREICADPIIRHDPNSTTKLSLHDQIARIEQQAADTHPYFEHEVLHADDTYVTSVWNMRTRKGDPIEFCGIEVFKAQDGKFTDCWNSSYVAGQWGREGDSAVARDLPPPTLISSADELTAEWLQRVFLSADVDIPRIAHVFVEPIGHGNFGTTVRADIRYNANADKAVQSVVCKLPSTLPQIVSIAVDHSAYIREVEIYRMFEQDKPCRAPRAYFAQGNETGDAFTIVMDDLTADGRPGDQIAGSSLADARAVMEEFANLHCFYWNDQKVLDAGWRYERIKHSERVQAMYNAGAQVIHHRFDGRLESRYLEVMDKFLPHVGRWTQANFPSRTMIHGEPRVDNIMFKDGENGPHAWLLDWQFADVGSPMYDTAYYLAGSLDPELRKNHEAELVEAHQSKIAEVDPGYSLEMAMEEYVHSLPFALFATVPAALAVQEGEHEDELLMTLLERNVRALLDWDVDAEKVR